MFYIETNRTLENKFPHLNCGRCANYNTSPQNFIQQISTMCVYCRFWVGDSDAEKITKYLINEMKMNAHPQWNIVNIYNNKSI
jgi:hypothetical protein